MNNWRQGSFAVETVVSSSRLLASPAAADRAIIKHPGQHPDYSFEAEPHGAVGFFNVGPGRDGIGVGFRGTIPIVDNGFIKTISNSVGIGFGIDWLHYDRNGCSSRTHAPEHVPIH